MVEPTTGIEPVDLFLTKEALYRLSYVGSSNRNGQPPRTASRLWSGRRDLNSRHPAWKAGALPAELHPPGNGATHIIPTRMTSHTRAIPRRHNDSCRKSCSDYRSRTAPPRSPTQDSYQVGGGGRIRTSVGISRQIYSLFPLAAREPHRGNDHHAAGSSEMLQERARKPRSQIP